MTEGKRNQKKAVSEVKTVLVPFALGEIKEKISIFTNTPSKRSKEQIIQQAFVSHSQGNIQEAAKHYQYFINQGLKDHRVFSNYGLILKSLGKLQEAEVFIRKAIDLNPFFVDGYINLGSILIALGKLKEAEVSLLKAIEINPRDKCAQNSLINLFTIYKPKNIDLNPLHKINEEFKKINISNKKNDYITDNEAIMIYKNGLEIYSQYNLDLETSLSQIYQRNELDFNCKRHKLIFNQAKIIPEFCFGCYKVQVEVNSIIDLIKLFLVFNDLKLKNKNTRKCLVELRNNISGFYKGLIYCLGLEDALEISQKLDIKLQNNIRIDLFSKVKRGCSEYPLEFPKYKEISKSGDQPMIYNEQWRNIEKEFDQEKKEWGKSIKSIKGFSLNDFLIMRNWIAYAIKIGDETVDKLTDEKLKGPKEFNDLNRTFYCNK